MPRRFAIAAVSACALLLAGAGGVVAQQVGDQRTRDLQQAADTRREIEDLRAELSRLNQQQVSAGADVDVKRARLETLHRRESALIGELGRDRGQLARLLSALQLFRRNPPPALLVNPGDARDAVRAAILIRAMTPDLQARADAYARQARAVGALRREAAAASEQLFTAESAMADRRGELERMIVEKTQLERAYAQDAIAADQERQTLGALTDGLATGGATGPLVLRVPAPGEVVRRWGDALPVGGKAEGLSIRTIKGQSVGSPAAGVVEYAGPLNGWDMVVIVRAQGAYHLVMAGMADVSVAPGQSVAAGASLGRMTDRGPLEPELYLEVRENGVPADPGRWLKQESR